MYYIQLLAEELSIVKSLSDKIHENALNYSGKIAFREFSREITYGQLLFLQNELQEFLKDKIKKNDIIGVSFEKSIDWVVCFSSITSTEGIVVPIASQGYPQLQAGELTRLKVKFLICNESLKSAFDKCGLACSAFQIPCLDKKFLLILDGIWEENRGHLDDVVYLNATSGSTGISKYAKTTNGNLFYNTISAIETFKLTTRDVHLCLFPFYMHPHEFIYRVVFSAAEGFLAEIQMADYKSIDSLIEKYKITHLMLTPSHLKGILLACSGSEKFRSIKIIECGGGIVTNNLIALSNKVFPVTITNVWGSTETTGVVISSFGQLPAENFLGLANTGYQIEVADNNEELSEIGTGEMVIHGEGVTSGYYLENSSKFKSKKYYSGDIVETMS